MILSTTLHGAKVRTLVTIMPCSDALDTQKYRKVETTSKEPVNSTERAMNYQNDLSARGKHQIVLCGCWQVRVRPVDYRRRKSRFNAAPS